jgi:hypothetical protein
MTGARVSMGCIGAATVVLWLGLIGYIVLTVVLGFASSAILLAIIGGLLLSLWTLVVAWTSYRNGFSTAWRLRLTTDGWLKWQAPFRSGRVHISTLHRVDTGPLGGVVIFHHHGGLLRCNPTMRGMPELLQTLAAWLPHLAIDVSGAQAYFDLSRALR